MRAYMYIRVYMYVHTCIRIYERCARLERKAATLTPHEGYGMGSLEIYAKVCIFTCMQICIYVHTYIHICVHTYVYVYM